MPRELHAGHAVRVVRVGAGPPCLFLHCALSRSESLFPLARAMAGPRSAIFVDIPGFGGSPDVPEARDHHTETAAIAAALCPEPTHVIGHSYGATVALRLAADHPDRIRRLTLIEPVFFAAARGTPEHTAHTAEFAPFVTAMNAGDHPRAAEMFNDLWGGQPWSTIPEATRARLTREIYLIPRSGPAIEDDAAGLLDPGRMAAITAPVLLIRGAATRPVIQAIHARLQQRLPQVSESVIAGAGHMVPITHPAEVAAAIASAA